MGRRKNRKNKSSNNKSSNGGAVQAGTTTPDVPADAAAAAAAGQPRPALAAVTAQINNIGPTNANSNAIGTNPFVFGSPHHPNPIKTALDDDDVPVLVAATPSPVGVDSTPVHFGTPALAATANADGNGAEAPAAIDADEMSLPTLIDGSTTEEDGFSSSDDDTDSEDEEDDGADENVKPAASSAPGDTAAASANNNDYPQDQKRAQPDAKPSVDMVGGVGAMGVNTDGNANAADVKSPSADIVDPTASSTTSPANPTSSDAGTETGTSNDNAKTDDDDKVEEEEVVDDVTHASMPSLIDGAASDPELDSDASDDWIPSTAGGDEADDESGGDDSDDDAARRSRRRPFPSVPSAQSSAPGSANPFNSFAFPGADNKDGGLMDLQQMMVDSVGVPVNAAGVPVPACVTDDDESVGNATGATTNAGSSPPTSSKKKKKSKKSRKKKKGGNKTPPCPITTAVKDGKSGADIEQLLASRGGDVSSFKSATSGHTLLQLAAMAGKVELLDWLVKEKDADPTHTASNGRTLEDYASTTPAKKKALSLTNWYQIKKQKEAEERRRLEEATAIRIQAVARTFNAQNTLRKLRKENDLGGWNTLVDKVLSYEIEARLNLGQDKLPVSFGKSWIQLKNELDLVVQDKELDLLGDSALKLSTTANDGAADEADSTMAAPNATTSENIQLTKDVLRWVRKQDAKKRGLFVDRLVKLAAGDRTHCRCELMKGSTNKVITAARLNDKESIVCSQRRNDILVWFVCPHEMVPRCRQLVELSYERVAESESAINNDNGAGTNDVSASESSTPSTVAHTNADTVEPEMLVDPSSNVPLKIHEVKQNELSRFKENANYIPTLKLTEEEESIVTRNNGTVLLLGRAGSGKTLVVSNRMLRDSQMYDSGTNQLFVARTQRLCKYVKGIFEGAGGDSKRVNFLSVSNFVLQLFENVAAKDEVGAMTRPVVDFKFFSTEIWPQIKGKEKALDDLAVWTQIRSFIKGSWDAAVKGVLSKEDYLSLPRERCRLAQDKREDAYAIFMRYKILLEEKGWLDSMDKTTDLIHKVMQTKNFKLYDKIYVDEVQDITQAEIGLLFLATGRQYDGLFLAGDPAQAVSQGVDFRFEEVRSLVYNMSGGKHKVERWEKLYRNFRSHEGILRVSNLVLDCLHNAFPGAAVKLPFDQGLTLGPRPGLLQSVTFEELARLVKANERLRILTRDEHKSTLCAELAIHAPGAKNNVWGIVEAKGLEFTDCVVVDFFSTMSDSAMQKSWKNLLLDPQAVAVSGKKGRGSGTKLPPAMELELKLFYTGITRACNRLLIIETKPSQAYDAFSRALQNKELGDVMTPDAVVREGTQIMTADDWRKEAFDLASLAEENEQDAANFLERAIAAMEKANDLVLLEKAELHLSAVQNEEAATAALMNNTSDYDELAVASLMSFLEAGLTSEAARACGAMAPPALKGLARRIMKLGEMMST